MPETYVLQSQVALPFQATPHDVIDRVVEFLRMSNFPRQMQSIRAVDLGAGDGRVVLAIASAFPLWHVRGVEINEELCNSARSVTSHLNNAEIVRGDLFQEDLSKIDVVFLFALPSIMPAMRHVFQELSKSALIITFRYPLNIPDFFVKSIYEENLHDHLDASNFYAYMRK